MILRVERRERSRTSLGIEVDRRLTDALNVLFAIKLSMITCVQSIDIQSLHNRDPYLKVT